MSTIKDVAREAGVSIASVSRYLNNPGSVRFKAGEKIEAAVKKLDYRIDSAAQSLKTGRFSRIGIISPSTGPHYWEMISSIENTLADSHYFANIFFTREPKYASGKRELPVKIKNVDGTIIMPLKNSSDEGLIKTMNRKGEKFVIIDGGKIYLDRDYYQVGIDNYEIGRQAAEIFTAKGHERFLYIKGHDDLDTSIERGTGFMETLNAKGINLSPDRIIPGDYNPRITMTYMAEKYDQLPDFTAIFAANDLMALGAMKALEENGRTVVKDYAIIGVDDLDMLPFLPVGLSTFRQPLQTVGQIGANMLISLIEGIDIREKKVVLQAQYIKRDSV